MDSKSLVKTEQGDIPGYLSGIGTSFKITNSDYINIELESKEIVNVILQSVPEIIYLQIALVDSTGGSIDSSGILLKGFNPNTTYHMYVDGLLIHYAFTTDEYGQYSYIQDLSVTHFIMIQPRTSTINLTASGFSSPVGTFDGTTAILNTDITDTISINIDNIALDGGGHIISSALVNGIMISGRKNVTIKNCNFLNGTTGILIIGSGAYSNTITNCTFSDNRATPSSTGISIATSSHDNIITNNSFVSTRMGIFLDGSSSGNLIYNNLIQSIKVNGVVINNSSNNKVYNNNFIDNLSVNASDMGTNNVFNLPPNEGGGNFFNRFPKTDTNYDGYSDTPIVINANRDYYPWMVMSGWLAPTTAAQLTGSLGTDGWYNSNVQITLNAVASSYGGGILATQYSYNNSGFFNYSGAVTISGEGERLLYFRSQNINYSEPSKAVKTKIDKTMPVINIISPADGGIYMQNQPLTSQWSAIDSLSGILSSSGTVESGNSIDTSVPGTMPFVVKATDKAGNQITKTIVYWVLDNTSPITTIDLEGNKGNNGWYVSGVKVTLTATDSNGSGVKSTKYRINNGAWNEYSATFSITDEGTKVIEYYSEDNDGNIETTKAETFKIDKTKPLVNIVAPSQGGRYILNSKVKAIWNATDIVSGIASAIGSTEDGKEIDTSSVSKKSFSVTAIDNAGNIVSEIVTYDVLDEIRGIDFLE